MHILNRSRVDDAVVSDIAQRSGVSSERLLVFLDSAVNAVRADSARTNLLEYREKSWTPLAIWEKDVTGETDIKACAPYPGASSPTRNSLRMSSRRSPDTSCSFI
jgi:hypothetical protein